MKPLPIDQLLKFGAENPIKFVNDLWPGGEDWQLETILSVMNYRRTAVVSCNGAGKTWVGARAIAWFLLTHPGSIVVTTAGTWTQVRRQLWKEIAVAYSRLPNCLQLPKLNTTDWTLSPEWYAIGVSTNDEHFFEGFHGRYVLIVVDEAKSVQQGIFDAINRIFAGKSDMVRLLIVSSPGNAEGPHFNAFNSKSDMYSRIKVNPFEAWQESPDGKRKKLEPTKHLSDEYIAEMEREYGKESPLYKSMVMAEHSADIAFRLFPPGNLRTCRDRVDVPSGAIVRVGADVARSTDGDENVFVAIHRWEAKNGIHYQPFAIKAFRTADSNVFEDELKMFCMAHGATANNVNVDGTGLGGPSCDHLSRDGFPVNEIQFAGSPTIEKPMLKNMRAQLWWQGAEAARPDSITGDVRLHGLDDTRLVAQLGEPKYSFDSAGRILIEAKKEMARRIAKERPRSPWRSPDRADALLLAMLEDGGQPLSFLDVSHIY